MDKLDQINTFNRLIKVSRETIVSLKTYESILIKANKSLNLVGNSTINQNKCYKYNTSWKVYDVLYL